MNIFPHFCEKGVGLHVFKKTIDNKTMSKAVIKILIDECKVESVIMLILMNDFSI
jgi:hypothetical protein